MGKGKGNIRKWRIRVRAKLIFLRFVGYKFSALHHIFFKKVEKKMPVPVHIFTTLFKRFSSRITRHTRLQYVLRKHF
jgi:ribosomal protein L16/L10AE